MLRCSGEIRLTKEAPTLFGVRAVVVGVAAGVSAAVSLSLCVALGYCRLTLRARGCGPCECPFVGVGGAGGGQGRQGAGRRRSQPLRGEAENDQGVVGGGVVVETVCALFRKLEHIKEEELSVPDDHFGCMRQRLVSRFHVLVAVVVGQTARSSTRWTQDEQNRNKGGERSVPYFETCAEIISVLNWSLNEPDLGRYRSFLLCFSPIPDRHMHGVHSR